MKYNPLIHKRRSIRLKGYDYSLAGAYFITICVKDRQCLFGEIIDGEMILNELGQIAYNEWLKTLQIRPNVSLDVFEIMPNHMHGIILINDYNNNGGRGESHSPDNEPYLHDHHGRGESHSPGDAMHLSNGDHGRGESLSPNNESHSPNEPGRGELHSPNNELHSPNNYGKGECNSPLRVPFRSPSNNIGAIVRGYKSSVTKQINLLNRDVIVWQRNYHEHVIRNEKSYQRISDYIINNAANWNEDKFHVN